MRAVSGLDSYLAGWWIRWPAPQQLAFPWRRSDGCISNHAWKFKFRQLYTGFTIRTLLNGKINPKDWQVLSLGDVGFLLFFRVVSGDYGKPWYKNTIPSNFDFMVRAINRGCFFLQPNSHQNIGLAKGYSRNGSGDHVFCWTGKVERSCIKCSAKHNHGRESTFLVGLSQYSMNYNVFFAGFSSSIMCLAAFLRNETLMKWLTYESAVAFPINKLRGSYPEHHDDL